MAEFSLNISGDESINLDFKDEILKSNIDTSSPIIISAPAVTVENEDISNIQSDIELESASITPLKKDEIKIVKETAFYVTEKLISSAMKEKLTTFNNNHNNSSSKKSKKVSPPKMKNKKASPIQKRKMLSPPKRQNMTSSSPKTKSFNTINKKSSPTVSKNSVNSVKKSSFMAPTESSQNSKTKKFVPKPEVKRETIQKSITVNQVAKASFLAPTKSSKSSKATKPTKPNKFSLTSKSNSNVMTSSGKSNWKPGKLTKPLSPNFTVDARPKGFSLMLSSEERELKAVQEAKKKEQERMRKCKKNVEKMKFTVKHPMKTAVRSTKELTIPKTPTSRLDARHGTKFLSTARLVCDDDEDRTKERKVAAPYATGRLTEPEPFQFQTDKRASARPSTVESEIPSTVFSMKELENKFMNEARTYDAPKLASSLTKPISPHFQPMSARVLPKSTAQREEEIMQAHQYKSKPVDHRIFESMGDMGVPKVKSRPLTEPVDIHFHSDERMALRESAIKKSSPAQEKAKTRKSLAPYMTGRPTLPESPKFNGNRRASQPLPQYQKPHHSIMEQERQSEKDKLVEKAKAPLNRELTEPVSPHLLTESRGTIHQNNFEIKKKAIEEANDKYAIKANPIPDFAKAVFYPSTSDKPLTEPEPFLLKSLVRHEHAILDLESKTKKNVEIEDSQRQFIARPVPECVHQGPTNIIDSKRDITISDEIVLHTEERACQRILYNEQNKSRVEEEENEKIRINQMKEDKENALIKEMRSTYIEEGGLNFKAKNIVLEDKYPNGPIQPISLTEPESPMLLTKRRFGTEKQNHIIDN